MVKPILKPRYVAISGTFGEYLTQHRVRLEAYTNNQHGHDTRFSLYFHWHDASLGGPYKIICSKQPLFDYIWEPVAYVHKRTSPTHAPIDLELLPLQVQLAVKQEVESAEMF